MKGCRPTWSGVLVLALAAVSWRADAADLALKRVMLSSGGVGYFEYETSVDGDATLTLDVALDQVDDVLKSLVVYDESGTAGEITLPGRNPLTQSFCRSPVRPIGAQFRCGPAQRLAKVRKSRSPEQSR